MQTLIYWCSSGYSDALLKPIHFQIHNPLSIIISVLGASYLSPGTLGYHCYFC